MITRRHVFHVGGYDPIPVEARYRRFQRELAIFERTWNVTAAVSDLEQDPERSRAWWTVTTRGPNWQVQTTYEVLFWDDIILRDFTRPTLSRLGQWTVAYLDFIRSGTMFKYFWASWSYGLFFLFPLTRLALYAFVAILVGRWLTNLVGINSWIAAAVIAICIFFGLLETLGRHWRVSQALDDWIFAYQYVHGRRRDIDARLDAFADVLLAQAQNQSLDEIIIVGHSMGASLVMDFVDRALMRDPGLGRHGPAVCLLTVGATTPKFTLHPAGGRFRGMVARIAQERTLPWGEYQARHDLISFCGFDPVLLRRGVADRGTSRPLIRIVAFSDMLSRRTYCRYALKFMRLHYQYVMANERRAPYDYFMMVCGPVPFGRMIESARGPLDLIAADGTLVGGAEMLPAEASAWHSGQSG
jgi:hypothetical protein